MQLLTSTLRQLPIQSKRFVRAASVAVCLAVASQTAMALPEEIEMDRYLLAAGSYLEENRLDQVAMYLEKIEALSKEPPALYHYYKARILRGKGDKNQERLALEDYVASAGKEGKYYTESLVRITALEEGLQKPKSDQAKANDTSLLAAFSKDREEASAKYAQKLKSLYLKNSFNEALVEHINILLATNGFTGKRLQSGGDKPILAYSVSIADGSSSILVVEKDRRVTPERLTTNKTNVFGQNPFIKHSCDYMKASCTVKKPDMYTNWFTVNYDESAAEELSMALSYLLQNLQQGKK